ITIDEITPDNPGYIRFKGEYWKARSDVPIQPNTKVVIIDKDETMLIVRPTQEKTTKS
ncbi:MAG: nodulation protein NfeD, partial [Thermoplasmata archaeon]